MGKLISNNKNFFRKLERFDHASRVSDKNIEIIRFKGKRLFNFASNDYLGFSKDRDIIESSTNWLLEYGASLSSSRLITGNLDKILSIEEIISKNIKHEKTIILGNGFLLNTTLIPAITGNSLGKKNVAHIFSDKLNHASIFYGCLLTRQKNIRYKHLDLNHLEHLLKQTPKRIQKIIISETIFSMDGDIVDIQGIRFLSEKYDAILCLDEAHALGVFGTNGFGLSSDKKRSMNELVVGTFSKAFGSYGSFVSCSEKYYKMIVNNCGGLIYSTVLPPSVLGAIDASVRKISEVDDLRKKIKENYKFVITSLKKLSLNTGNSDSHIIPIIIKNHVKCKKLCEYFFKNGFFIKEIRPPSVPLGSERIRLSISATMDMKLLKEFVNLISKSNII